jgi:hypothetical protein
VSVIHSPIIRAARCAAVLLLAGSAPLVAQAPDPITTTGKDNPVVLSSAIGAHFQGYRFAAGSDVDASQLFLIPLSYQALLAPNVSLDAYSVHIDARAKSGPTTIRYNGQLDSWLRLRWQYTPSTVLAIGFSVPTGLSKQDPVQAAIASIISNDLLGYREGNWGAGWSTTAGITSAFKRGGWRISSGASVRLSSPFESKADTNLRYAPGNELRLRLSGERTYSNGVFSTGLTFQTFQKDQYNNKNIFAAGPRVRFDVAYDFPSLHLGFTNLWRSKGDLSAEVLNAIDGTYLRDTMVTVGWQNLQIYTASTSRQLTKHIAIAPEMAFKWRTSSEQAGRGWLALGALFFPMKWDDLEYFPGVKYGFGALVPSLAGATSKSLSGGEISFIFRHPTRNF